VVNTLLFLRYESVLPVVFVASALLLLKALLGGFMASTHEPFLAEKALVGWVVIAVNIATSAKSLKMIFFTIISMLCLDSDTPYFNAIMLLAIAFKSSTLQNVIKSVTIPSSSLALSGLLGLICMYIFSIFAFYFLEHEFFSEDQSVDECSTLSLCFVTFLHGGFLCEWPCHEAYA
jgi:hypothetical protein